MPELLLSVFSSPTAIPASGVAADDRDAASHADAVESALRSSRDRWREFALLGCDLAFEADASGRIVFAAPAGGLGWTPERLQGQPIGVLLAESGTGRPDALAAPSLPGGSRVNRLRVRARRGDGQTVDAVMSVVPDATGARGILVEEDARTVLQNELAAEALRGRLVAEINRRMRRSTASDTVLRIGLAELMDAVGARGAMLIGCGDAAEPAADDEGDGGLRRLQQAGEALTLPDEELSRLLQAKAAQHGASPWQARDAVSGRQVLLAADTTRFFMTTALVLWRDGDEPWSGEDMLLAGEILSSLCVRIEADQVQRDLAVRSRTDMLTGLLSRSGFIAEVNRRLDRLDAEGLHATLLVAALDGLEPLIAAHGYEKADAAIQQAGSVLRDAIRPTDLVGRIGTDSFALWLDGADPFAAAERAEGMCRHGVPIAFADPPRLGLSIGLAARPARSFETVSGLLEQAGAALSAVKAVGGGRWHVYNEGDR